jgi:catechol 2,3-dioxygenase-like lactoylglutathione lyase family enzyme
MDLQQPLSWFAGKPLPGNGQTQHGDRRHHTRYETEPIQNGRVVLASNSPTNGGITDAFYYAALDAGGTDNGEPGLRPHYHTNYYGAFVLDPDGNNVEMVRHAPD